VLAMPAVGRKRDSPFDRTGRNRHERLRTGRAETWNPDARVAARVQNVPDTVSALALGSAAE
jgi:hypothetical protein